MVPGCSGTPKTDWEYCIDPNAMPSNNATYSGTLHGAVEGDSIESGNYTGPALSERDGLNRCEGDW